MKRSHGGWTTTWKKRWMVTFGELETGGLRYYEHPDDVGNPKGSFPINLGTVVRRSRKDDKKFAFEMVTDNDTYYMHCGSEDDRAKWITAVERLVQWLNSNTTNWREQVIAFYKKHNPSKLNKVDQLLAVHKGKEAKLLADLRAKYKPKGFFGGGASGPDPEGDICFNVIDGVKRIYYDHVAPVERKYKFDKFYQPIMRESEFVAKPMCMCIGQYSVGKTTFIRYLLGRDFPGIRIGPEPTTDRFHILMHGDTDKIIPGHAMSMDRDMPFETLQRFGTAFLNRFEGAKVDSPLLKKVTIVDTPGVLAGEKQRINRAYEFPEVVRWFAHKCDRILCLFDAHKLDISDEFKKTIEALEGNDDKLRLVLNKADAVTQDQLVCVYGALLWQLGKVFTCPEVPKVYISSFWDKPYNVAKCGKDAAGMFDRHKRDLMSDLRGMPRNTTIRRINEMIQRTKAVKVHAHIIGYLYDETPKMFGQKKKMDQLKASIPDVFFNVQRKYDFIQGDFPNLGRFEEKLAQFEAFRTDFCKCDNEMLRQMDDAIKHSFPKLIAQLPSNIGVFNEDEMPTQDAGAVNPFDDAYVKPGEWLIEKSKKEEYDNIFYGLEGADSGFVGGGVCVPAFKSFSQGMSDKDLGKIWNLADNKKRGKLDHEQFAVAMYLIGAAVSGHPTPAKLPGALIPPSQRDWDHSMKA